MISEPVPLAPSASLPHRKIIRQWLLPLGRASTPRQHLMYRIYRSGWAPGLYYLLEIWWKRMVLPGRRWMPTRRAVFALDNLLVCAWALAWIAGLWLAAAGTGQAVLPVMVAGLLVPFAFWWAMIGFVVYVHHTHPAVRWHADRAAWSRGQPFVSTTVHLTFPGWMGALLHHIMEHTAHHVDMGIPLYRLKAAQALLERALPRRIVVQRFSWRWYFDTARRCKLYDFEHAGRPTSQPRPA